ncbi:carbohydrate ABC transporter permease [Lacrimispora saccharolytica]|uniref:Binding-protein-dependent transport systems inner membrane component n=1 Tax=Lacrimispora saccharolytica (strain ATCC 35040 / DSM 2544 / NRCC 2533 / WM1) TaxID=610130 RepID=D9R489_LACSW|nr:carbohydrate ABC transporter permease [Lacrimispora saccharolytica]ADL04959.1 binding-protein-dependent transport systems inner membrane component [[Clostridium] saccharolyticum WM1]QRV20837.1 carbohydrate ABC transporter permease [Lacrimispora saccharolytica]
MSHKLKSTALYLFLIIGVIMIAYPVYLTLITSMKTPQELSQSFFALPKRFNFNNFYAIITDSGYPRTVLNTLAITLFASIGTIAVIPMVSYAIARSMREKRYYKYLYFFLLAGIFVPFTVKMLPLVKVMSVMNMLNIPGLIIVYISSAVCEGVFLYVAFIQGIPMELEEAAYIDGASTWNIYLHIVFPLLSPMTATVLIKNGLWYWNDFLLPLLTLNKSPDFWTLTLFQYNFKMTHAINYPMIFAAFLLSMLPVMVFYVFMQKKIIGGLTNGAVKG